MKNIIVITTGGTIGSILSSDYVGVDISERRIAKEIHLAKSTLGCSVNILSPINKHSEDILPADWIKILKSIKEANDGHSSGVVVTHGTDTMAYSVSAALAFNNLWSKKICFNASYHAPDHPSSDTALSLLASLEFANSVYPASGVYVVFRTNKYNNEAQIIHGASLKPMYYDDLSFKSAYYDKVATFNPKHGISNEISLSTVECPCLDSVNLPEIESVMEACSQVGMIKLYPGIDKKFLTSVAKGRRILIIETYHSGTGPADDSNPDLLEFIREANQNIKILMGTFPKRNIDMPYKSTLKLISAGAHIYCDLQPHFLYTFSLLGISLGIPCDKLIEKLKPFEISSSAV